MQKSSPSTRVDESQPKAHQISRSFKRLESTRDNPLRRDRASTFPDGYKSEPLEPVTLTSSLEDESHAEDGIFSFNNDESSEVPENAEARINEHTLTETFEELPANVRSLTEKFLDSLSAKVYPTPLSIDSLSQLFQDFYVQAELKLSEHVTRITAQPSRETSPAPSVSSRSSATSKIRGQAGAGSRSVETSGQETGAEQQLLTASEIASKKKTRKLLEIKKVAYEEAVERLVCAKVYNRIWRHRSTDDKERDQKLQSRAEALAVVGIGLKELHLGSTETDQKARHILVDKEELIREWLDEVTEELIRMNEKYYPLGKLQDLVAAHKGIVKILSKLFPSSSSADEILPMLIYSLVTSQCENLNIISNLNFIQRFRANDKLNGEAAYCLVNLEAAVSFLETVDLSSLRADEAHRLPIKESNVALRSQSEIPQNDQQINPKAEYRKSDSENPENNSALEASPRSLVARTSFDRNNQGRFSAILQNQSHRLEAVRGEIIGSADQAFDNISSTLDNSFNFLFGRLREQAKKSDTDDGDNYLPKTLEDARKLVGTPPPTEDDNDSVSSVNFFTQSSQYGKDKIREEQRSNVSDVPVQHKLRTETSQDSIRRAAGPKRSAYPGADVIRPSQHGRPQRATFQAQTPTSVPNQASASNVAVESMKNLGNTLNPLKGFSNMNIMPRFGRGTASPTSSESQPGSFEGIKDSPLVTSPNSLRMADELRRAATPSKRFLDVKDASELRIKDVEELLRDYRRLADGINKVTNT